MNKITFELYTPMERTESQAFSEAETLRLEKALKNGGHLANPIALLVFDKIIKNHREKMRLKAKVNSKHSILALDSSVSLEERIIIREPLRKNKKI